MRNQQSGARGRGSGKGFGQITGRLCSGAIEPFHLSWNGGEPSVEGSNVAAGPARTTSATPPKSAQLPSEKVRDNIGTSEIGSAA